MSFDDLVDQYDRRITYLRLSLTDQCNFRCIYCLPPEGLPTVPKDTYLKPDEIKRLVHIFCDLGIEKLRLTGGEPLLRSDILTIVGKIAAMAKVKDIAITTNGSRLLALARPLKECGLNRLNISLDSLNPSTFQKMSLRQNFTDVMDGITEALRIGLPVKINVVVMRGLNDGEIADFIDFVVDHSVEEVRFIEFMPLCGTGWKPEYVYLLGPWIKKVQNEYGARPVAESADSVAKSFEIDHNGKRGRVGFITTMSNPFCNSCSRIRVTADGVLRPCLFSSQGTSLKELLQRQATDQEIVRLIRETVWHKKEGNEHALAKAKDEGLDFGRRGYRHGITANPFIHSIGG